MVEHSAVNRRVAGSNPASRASFRVLKIFKARVGKNSFLLFCFNTRRAGTAAALEKLNVCLKTGFQG